KCLGLGSSFSPAPIFANLPINSDVGGAYLSLSEGEPRGEAGHGVRSEGGAKVSRATVKVAQVELSREGDGREGGSKRAAKVN
ncbi:unnamed protein product, partial [Urochloa humidicola]